AEQRAGQADARAQAAVERVDRVEAQARLERLELERELGVQRDVRQAAELEHGRAQAALEGERQLRARLEHELADAGKRLQSAEKARDAAIASVEQAATRGTPPRRKASQ
ncbi:MAG: hypothetical protein M3Y17_11830, partial [Actinomycetota bacterium]|nr:hypothetical protein [Actinomycetota bacterium]